MTIREIIWFYLIYLLGSVITVLIIPDDALATAMLVGGIVDAFLILGYWWYTRTSLRTELSPRIALCWPVAIGCGLLLVLLPLNIVYHHLLAWLFSLTPSDSGLGGPFATEGYGLAVQLLVIALMPAIWEEIAFRGLIQKRLSDVVGPKEAIGLTAILFGIIHVDWLSLPYLILIGVVLGILRHRSGSLLPGMILHFLHNAAVLLLG